MESKAAVLQDLNVLQRMVDMRITSLEGLRKEGSSGSGLIQHEIRTVEVSLLFFGLDLPDYLRCFVHNVISKRFLLVYFDGREVTCSYYRRSNWLRRKQ